MRLSCIYENQLEVGNDHLINGYGDPSKYPPLKSDHVLWVYHGTRNPEYILQHGIHFIQPETISKRGLGGNHRIWTQKMRNATSEAAVIFVTPDKKFAWFFGDTVLAWQSKASNLKAVTEDALHHPSSIGNSKNFIEAIEKYPSIRDSFDQQLAFSLYHGIDDLPPRQCVFIGTVSPENITVFRK